MLTKFEAHRAYKLVIDKMFEYEQAHEISPAVTWEILHPHYEHLKSMSEYLANSLELGATEVLLNMAEVSSLTRKIS